MPRAINDAGATAPYTARFRPEVGALDVSGIAGQAGTSGNISGTWTLRVTDHTNDRGTTLPTQSVGSWSLKFSHISTSTNTTGGFGTDRRVTTIPIPGSNSTAIPVTGAVTTPYPLVTN